MGEKTKLAETWKSLTDGSSQQRNRLTTNIICRNWADKNETVVKKVNLVRDSEKKNSRNATQKQKHLFRKDMLLWPVVSRDLSNASFTARMMWPRRDKKWRVKKHDSLQYLKSQLWLAAVIIYSPTRFWVGKIGALQVGKVLRTRHT